MASAAYERRNARARAEGYASYYDKRARGGRGPDAPRLKGEALARARGHRGQADLLKSLGPTKLVIHRKTQRSKDGKVQWVELMVVDATGKQPDRVYRLRGD